MMIDHRCAPRWRINWQARIMQEGKEDFCDCQIRDVNYKGMQVVCDEELLVDSYVTLTIMVSGSFAFKAEAWVVWCRHIQGARVHGLAFTKFMDADKEALYRFIQKQFPLLVRQQLFQDLTEKGGERMEDRRTFERFAASFPVRVLDAASGAELQARSFDVSAKGIGVVAKDKLQPHAPVEMWLAVSDAGEPIYGRGEVMWTKTQGATEYRCGINLERADLMGLSRVLRTSENHNNS